MTIWSPTKETATIWKGRVDEWRASGETAARYAESRGFAPSTLRYWAYLLKRRQKEEPKFVRLVPRRASVAPAAEVVIEVAGARVRVSRGFDPSLLADVVRALGGASR